MIEGAWRRRFRASSPLPKSFEANEPRHHTCRGLAAPVSCGFFNKFLGCLLAYRVPLLERQNTGCGSSNCDSKLLSIKAEGETITADFAPFPRPGSAVRWLAQFTAFINRSFKQNISFANDPDSSHAYSRFEGRLEGLDFHSRRDRDGCGK
jgi:hypothetical protein